jgi:YesN/AraC family two-component response regulator
MLRILIVDDEKKARDYIADLLLDALPDVVITRAPNSREALELIQTHYYDILMTDIDMPDMDGLSMIEKITRLNLSLFIVLVSAFDKFEYAQKGIELDTNYYILKPVHKELIERMIEKYRKFQQLTQPSRTVVFRRGQGSFPIRIKDILAVKIQGRNFVKVYKTNGILDCICEKLNEVFARLPDCFVYINRQCFVNTSQIKTFNCIAKEITMLHNGKEIVFQVSRNFSKKIKDLLKPA